MHRDGARFGLSPFEAEQRRRTWWQLVALDKRIAEITGSPITALSSCGSECQLPLNVNDSDLHPDSKDPPRPSLGFTEMSFGLTRIELTLASARHSNRPNPLNKSSQSTREHSAISPHAVPPSTHHMSSHDMEGYESYFDSTYMRYCDPKIPIQRFTMLVTKVGMCKFHVVNFICRGVPASSLSQGERDELFLKAIQMLEYDDAIYTSDNLRGFRWYTQLHVPLPGYIFLASELVHRTSGELCERAWQAICNNHEHRRLGRNMGSPMHIAFGHALLKAWNSREQDDLKQGRASEPPKLVTLLRQRLSSKSKGKNPDTADRRADFEYTALADSTATEPRMSIGLPSGLENTYIVPEILSGANTTDPSMPSIENTDMMFENTWVGSDKTDLVYLMQSGALGDLFGSDGSGFA